MVKDGAGEASRGQDAESRFATLVKLDIVDSTLISHRLSRSDRLELRRGFTSVVETVAKPFGIKIEWEGDGALLTFGYPDVRIDAAEAAVRAGLQLVEAIRTVKVVPTVQLELRVGIASGPVTIDLLSTALEGLAINKAERLKTAAAPGQVLIADDTRHLVRNFFEYEDLGSLPLKGFDGLTRVWRVVRATSVVSRFAAQRSVETPIAIVGREAALTRLSAAWADARAGRGSAVCLVGDAGNGKSRLARVALESAKRDRAVVLEVDCSPSTGNTPLQPVGVLLQRMAGIVAGASEDEKTAAATQLLTRLLSEPEIREALLYLGPLFGLQSTPIPLNRTREQVRAQTIATIVAMFRALAVQSPVAFLCEDLHWADDTTAQVVQDVGQMIEDLRAILVITRWPKAVTPVDLDSVTATFTTIAVEPLPADIAADLVRAVAGDSLSSERVGSIVSRCGGVPLLLEEVTHSILEEEDVRATFPRTAPLPASAVPPELQLVVESRLGRWPNLKSIVEAASVLGREFPVSLLEAMEPGRNNLVAEALTVFTDHGLFAPAVPDGHDRAAFKHALIRDAVYETLVSKEYLRGLHSRAADALRGHLGTPDASPDVLAQHLRIAARLSEAITVRLAAAEDTFKRGAYVEAKGHCEAADTLIEEVSDTASTKGDAFRLCVLRGMVGAGIHGYSAEPVTIAYRAAERMFDDTRGPDLRYPVIRGLATAHLVRGDLATAYRYSLDGLDLAERSNRPDYRIDAMSVLSYTTLYFGRLEDCRSWIEHCLDLYDSDAGETFRYPVPQDAKTAALALLPTAAWLLGDAGGAEEAIERGLTHVDRLGREFDKALLHGWIAGTRFTQRRYGEALQHAGIAYTLGHEHKFQEWEAVGGMMALLSQSALQPSPDAIAQAIAAGQAFKANGIGLNGSYFLWGVAIGMVRAGNSEGARAMLGFALDAAAASQETRMNPEIWMLMAEIEVDREKAFRLLMDAFNLAQTQGAVANALRAACALMLRNGGDEAARERGRAAQDFLDGRAKPDADQPQWMPEELARLRPLVRLLQPAAHGA
jgi:class 3 adenylate cyclase